MKAKFKMLSRLYDVIQADLGRPHPFALERVGFISCAVGWAAGDTVVLVARGYHPLPDDHYVEDKSAGAVIGGAAFRAAFKVALQLTAGIFHVHRHEHKGRPRFSGTDLTSSGNFVPDFWNVQPRLPHGAVVLSQDSAAGLCWYPGRRTPMSIREFSVVGSRIRKI